MSAEAGWYDDGSGRQRWWDGQQWTEHFADDQARGRRSASTLLSNLTARGNPSGDENALWSATGKPLTGIGAGRYRLTDEYLIFESGALSTRSQQIRVHEIHDVDARQSMAQKARGIGTITLWAHRPSGNEKVLLEDIPNFRDGVAIINRVADEARHRLQTRQNTQHVNYSGAPGVTPTPGAAAPASASSDLHSELTRLAELRNRGVLDDEEFAAAKRKLLGL